MGDLWDLQWLGSITMAIMGCMEFTGDLWLVIDPLDMTYDI